MQVQPERDRTPSDDERVGRFLRGKITQRSLSREGGGLPEAAFSLAVTPLTVTLTDTVREITGTIPHGRDVAGGVGEAITAYTTTIPAITRTITENVTIVP